MKPKKLFPEVPADLTDLDRDALSALETSVVNAARLCAAGDDEFTADVDASDVITQMTDGVVELERIRAALTTIEQGEAEFTAQMGDLAAQFGIEDAPETVEEPEVLADASDDDPDDDEDAEEPDAEASADPEVVEEVAVPVTASAVKLRRPPAAPASHRPRTNGTADQGAPLLASAGLEGAVRPGQILDRKSLALALGEAQGIGTSRGQGSREKVIVASAKFQYPDDRQLVMGNPAQNWERIFAHTSPQSEAVIASGGFCAVFPPRYDLPILATAIRPVRDSLPTFGTPRGGVQFPTPLGLSDVTGGITVVTAEEDAGTLGVKACVRIECDDFQSAEVQAIAACVEHGNLDARAWPERVDNVTELLAAAHAQAAETELLAGMTALSTQVTDEAKYGAYSTLIQGILKAGAAYRSRHRMNPSTALHVWLPAWVLDLVAADAAHNGFGRYDAQAARTGVDALFARANVRVTWYVDQDGTTTQVYDAQTAGTLDEFLTEVVWYLAAEGTFGFLDFGRLDLGLVRDSGLNSTNDFNVFWETFEGIAKFGIEAIRVVSTVCPSGATAPAGTIITC